MIKQTLNKLICWFRDSEVCTMLLLRQRVCVRAVRCVAGVLADVPEPPAGPAGPLQSFISKWVPSAGLLVWRWRWTEWDTFKEDSCVYAAQLPPTNICGSLEIYWQFITVHSVRGGCVPLWLVRACMLLRVTKICTHHPALGYPIIGCKAKLTSLWEKDDWFHSHKHPFAWTNARKMFSLALHIDWAEGNIQSRGGTLYLEYFIWCSGDPMTWWRLDSILNILYHSSLLNLTLPYNSLQIHQAATH